LASQRRIANKIPNGSKQAKVFSELEASGVLEKDAANPRDNFANPSDSIWHRRWDVFSQRKAPEPGTREPTGYGPEDMSEFLHNTNRQQYSTHGAENQLMVRSGIPEKKTAAESNPWVSPNPKNPVLFRLFESMDKNGNGSVNRLEMIQENDNTKPTHKEK